MIDDFLDRTKKVQYKEDIRQLFTKIVQLSSSDRRLYAIVLAEKVLPNFERVYPEDEHPRKLIEAAKKYAHFTITPEELEAARDGVWDSVVKAREDLEAAYMEQTDDKKNHSPAEKNELKIKATNFASARDALVTIESTGWNDSRILINRYPYFDAFQEAVYSEGCRAFVDASQKKLKTKDESIEPEQERKHAEEEMATFAEDAVSSFPTKYPFIVPTKEEVEKSQEKPNEFFHADAQKLFGLENLQAFVKNKFPVRYDMNGTVVFFRMDDVQDKEDNRIVHARFSSPVHSVEDVFKNWSSFDGKLLDFRISFKDRLREPLTNHQEQEER
jgi:hypothetical protein